MPNKKIKVVIESDFARIEHEWYLTLNPTDSDPSLRRQVGIAINSTYVNLHQLFLDAEYPQKRGSNE